MKFQSGDLVIVVWSKFFPDVVGRVLTLTTPCPVWPDSWDTDPPVVPSGRAQHMSLWEPQIRLVRGQGVPAEVVQPEAVAA